MTEIENLKQELQETKLMLFLLQEMNQFKGGFLARSAHEMKAPLSSLIGLQQMILEGLCESPEEEREFIALGKNYCLKLLDLLNQLIYISQTEVGQFPLKLRGISLNKILENVHNLVKVNAKNQGLRLKVNLLKGADLITTDYHIIKQVLLMILNCLISLLTEGEILVNPMTLEEEKIIVINFELPRIEELLRENTEVLKEKLGEQIEENYQLIKQQIITGQNLLFSPSFTVMIAQTLLEKIGGKLSVNLTPNLAQESHSKSPTMLLQCELPLAIDGEKSLK